MAAPTFSMPAEAVRTAIINQPVLTNKVMSPSELNSILAIWHAAYPPRPAVTAVAATATAAAVAAEPAFTPDWNQVAFQLAKAMADEGSSPETVYKGGIYGISYNDLALMVVQGGVTRRQYCAFFAKVLFNTYIAQNRPPANWQDQGYTHDTRFVGFDANFAINHASAYNPAKRPAGAPATWVPPLGLDARTGLKRQLTQAELNVIQANKSVHISRRVQQLQEQSTLVEASGVRRGRSGTGIQFPGLGPPPS